MKRGDVDRWFRPVRVPMALSSYMRLPHHPAYKFEYWDGQVRISPRWRSHGMFLVLVEPPHDSVQGDLAGGLATRLLLNADWDVLPEVLADAFADSPPLGFLSSRRRLWAARDWLSATRDGGEGALVEPACFVAVDREDSSRVVAALLVTLMAGWTRTWFAARRPAVLPPPSDLAEGRQQAQMSWIFVNRACSGQGVGKALLARATRSLWTLGYRELASATDGGNVASMAWHWRNGFRLLPQRKPIQPRPASNEALPPNADEG